MITNLLNFLKKLYILLLYHTFHLSLHIISKEYFSLFSNDFFPMSHYLII